MLRSLAIFCLFCADVLLAMQCQVIYENIALNKPATQSSTYASDRGAVASMAVDGNDDPNWLSGSCTHTLSEQNPWWKVDLGKVSKVARVLITNRKDCCADRLKDFKVEVGDTDTTMKLCAHHAAAAMPGQEVVLTCPKDMTGRFVKISLNNRNFLTLCEVKVYSM